MSGGGSKKQTVGYKYYLGIHFALIHGPADYLPWITVDKRIAWDTGTTGGQITIDAPKLFGGEKREGGVQGTVDIEMGASDQTTNDYLAAQLGTPLPAFRGVMCAVLRQVYIGMNPYLKNWAFRVRRIVEGWNTDGGCWYEEKAAIVPEGEDTQGTAAVTSVGTPVDYDGGFWFYHASSGEIRMGCWEGVDPYIKMERIRVSDGAHQGYIPLGAPSERSWNPYNSVYDEDNDVLYTEGDDYFVISKYAADNGAFVAKTDILEELPYSPALDPYTGHIWCASGSEWYRVLHYDTSLALQDTVDITPSSGTFYVGSITFSSTHVFVCCYNYGSIQMINKSTLAVTEIRGVYPSVSPRYYVIAHDGDRNCLWGLVAGEAGFRKLSLSDYSDTTYSLPFTPDAVIGEQGQTVRNSFYNPDTGMLNFSDSYYSGSPTGQMELRSAADPATSVYSGDPNAKTWYASPEVYSVGNCWYFMDSAGALNKLCATPAAYVHQDMNPAHIIYQCLTDPEWGMGYATAKIDDAAFTAAADTLYTEKLGMSLTWDRQIPIEDFIKEILKHIDAVLYVSRTTGKFVLKLVRDDYVVEDLLVLDESNVDKVDNLDTTAIGELVNSVTIKYWDYKTGNTASSPLHDPALIQVQGAIIDSTIEYNGFTNAAVAARIAARDLKSLATPLISCIVYANREAASLNIGHAFVLTWPDAALSGVVMRVTNIAFGDGRNNRVKITCTQDIFSLPGAVSAPAPDTGWSDPTLAPAPCPDKLVIEAPYYEVVQRKGDDEAALETATYPERGYLLVAATRPTAATINAELWVDAGAGYKEGGQLDFCPYAELSADIVHTDETISIGNGVDLEDVAAGTLCLVGDELCKVVSVTTTTLTAKRGLLDTVPATHVAGTAVWFFDVYGASDNVEYADSETISAKVLPTTGQGTLDIADDTAGSVTMDSRAARPYPPGQFKINASYYPEWIDGTAELALTYADRDRLQQSDGDPIDYTAGSVGPESGQTYTLRIYGEAGTLLRTETALTSAGYTYDSADEISDSGLGRINGRLRAELESVRASLPSWQMHDHTVLRDGYGFNYGYYYGGH